MVLSKLMSSIDQTNGGRVMIQFISTHAAYVAKVISIDILSNNSLRRLLYITPRRDVM